MPMILRHRGLTATFDYASLGRVTRGSRRVGWLRWPVLPSPERPITAEDAAGHEKACASTTEALAWLWERAGGR